MANRLRQLLILISLVAFLTGGIWRFYPRGVEWVDWALRGIWMERIEVDMQKARELRAEGDLDGAEEVLAGLVDSLAGVQVGDRRDPWWRIAQRERIQILRKADRYEEAIACAREYREHAPRDADNLLTLGVLLMRMPEHVEEGLQVLGDLQRWIPEWSRAADAYAKALVSEGRDQEAVEVGLQFLKRGDALQAADWMFFWDVGNSFEGDHSQRMDLEQGVAPREYVALVKLPPLEKPVRALRIDPPVWASLRLSNWTVTVKVGDQVFAFDKAGQLDKRSRIRELPNNALETHWDAHCDMRITFDQPLLIPKNSKIEFRGHIDATLPPGVRQLFEDPKKAPQLSKWLRESGRRDDLALIRRAMGT
ncbi:MAG: hypothetical protein KDC14_18680 [Planctomycetes bacterium]|nr:hypothetical protein [Planctomycetota bacterium]